MYDDNQFGGLFARETRKTRKIIRQTGLTGDFQQISRTADVLFTYLSCVHFLPPPTVFAQTSRAGKKIRMKIPG